MLVTIRICIEDMTDTPSDYKFDPNDNITWLQTSTVRAFNATVHDSMVRCAERKERRENAVN